MAFSGPKYGITRSDAENQQISVPTHHRGTFAYGHRLLWRKHVPAFLPQIFQVPWTFVSQQNVLVTPKTLVPEDVWVWERVPKESNREKDMRYIMMHLYFNYYLKHRHAALNGLNPIIPLLDIQAWKNEAAITMVTPMFYNCNKHWPTDSDSQQWFWTFSTLMSLLLLHSTGVLHLDLSQNNLFQVQNQPCKLKYKQHTLLLPFFPVLTDFDEVCLVWETQAERTDHELEKHAVQYFLNEQKYLCEHYSKLSLLADTHIQELINKNYCTIEECLDYLFSIVQPSGVCCGPQESCTLDFTDAMYFDSFYKDSACREGIRFVMHLCHCDEWVKQVYDLCSGDIREDVCEKPSVATKVKQLDLLNLGFKSKKPRTSKMAATLLLLLI